jgi:hypothetical protein
MCHHDWGNNLITIEGNGMMRTIVMTKHFDNNTKGFEILLFYNMIEGMTNKEIIFIVELKLFTIGTITLLETKKISAVIFGEKVGIKDLTFNFPHFEGHIQADTTLICIKV